MLTTTLPLVMLGLWTSVAAEAPFRGFESKDFVAYYLAALIVRNVTGTWVAYQINEEIRSGTLSMRLLRPIHPFAGYAASHLSAVPLRALIALPITVILLVSSARDVIADRPLELALFAISLVGAWLLTFSIMVSLGALAFWLQRSMGIIEIYWGVFAVLSGYLIPLPLMPGWIQRFAEHAPFRYMLSAPVEILIGQAEGAAAARLVAIQAVWAAALLALALAIWRAGIRRFEAYGA